jgi:hypothetical protein
VQHPHFCHQAKVMVGPPRFPGTAHAVSVVCPVLFDTTSRTDGRSTGLRWAPHMGISEDLSELHRFCEGIAVQKYYCRQMRSWRDSLPRLLLDERVSLGTFRFGTCIDTGASRAGGHGAFSASLSSFLRRLIC